MTEKNETLDVMSLVAKVVACYVSNNAIRPSDLPALMQQVHQSLREVGSGKLYLFQDRPEPVVPINESVQPDYIICLEDGRRLKMLKRHLRTTYNLSPDQYRERWGLSQDYPMIAPNYATQRSHLARDIGLGRKSKKQLNHSI